MQNGELDYYSKIGNWDFDDIKVRTEKISEWDFYKEIKKYTNGQSLCLDIGTGGGEKALKYYPTVGYLIGTDFSKEMIETAKKNREKYPELKIKFILMDNLNMTFSKGLFNLVSARHTVIDAKQIYECLSDDGILIVEGVDKKDCWSLKEMFGRGQAFNDETPISQKDYENILNAGFKDVELVEIKETEFYETEEDLMALLLKTSILDDFSEINSKEFEHKPIIEKDIFEKYVGKNRTEKGIRLDRVSYGIIAKK